MPWHVTGRAAICFDLLDVDVMCMLCDVVLIVSHFAEGLHMGHNAIQCTIDIYWHLEDMGRV